MAGRRARRVSTMARRQRLYRRVFVGACLVLAVYESWWVFVRETPAVTIQGYHPRAADEFGQSARVSQAFRMTANGLSAVEVQFSTSEPLTLLVRCTLSEISPPGSRDEPREAIATSSRFVTIKRVSGVEWRRISFPGVEASDKRWYVLRLELIGAVRADDASQPLHAPASDSRPRVALVVSNDNVFGGGALWISDRRQLGSLSLRAFTHRRTAYERFRADVTPALAPILRNAAVDLVIFVTYQWALLTVLYVLLIADPLPAMLYDPMPSPSDVTR